MFETLSPGPARDERRWTFCEKGRRKRLIKAWKKLNENLTPKYLKKMKGVRKEL
jgi:hypothetical protein